MLCMTFLLIIKVVLTGIIISVDMLGLGVVLAVNAWKAPTTCQEYLSELFTEAEVSTRSVMLKSDQGDEEEIVPMLEYISSGHIVSYEDKNDKSNNNNGHLVVSRTWPNSQVKKEKKRNHPGLIGPTDFYTPPSSSSSSLYASFYAVACLTAGTAVFCLWLRLFYQKRFLLYGYLGFLHPKRACLGKWFPSFVNLKKLLYMHTVMVPRIIAFAWTFTLFVFWAFLVFCRIVWGTHQNPDEPMFTSMTWLRVIGTFPICGWLIVECFQWDSREVPWCQRLW